MSEGHEINQGISHDTYFIAGIKVHVYGNNKVPIDSIHKKVFVLYVAHQRLGDYKAAEKVISSVMEKIQQEDKKHPIIAVTFDLRNHGERMVNSRGNLDWNEGNISHAQDMTSIIDGSVQDFELVMEYLPIYLPFEAHEFKNFIMGVSLGGHIAWRMVTKVMRIQGMISIIGSPYLKSMILERYYHQHNVDTKGASDEDELIENVPNHVLSPYLVKILNREDEGIRTLPECCEIGILCGKKDQLVPPKYAHQWLDDNAWRKNSDKSPVLFEDDCGHECTPKMLEFSANLLEEWMAKYS